MTNEEKIGYAIATLEAIKTSAPASTYAYQIAGNALTVLTARNLTGPTIK